ncbi:MAG: hypothetical protein LBC79_02285 [Deltaproteobacteria bacterium]|nr:hypothetical protein [Deltaproteobacteria bacterium]
MNVSGDADYGENRHNPVVVVNTANDRKFSNRICPLVATPATGVPWGFKEFDVLDFSLNHALRPK